MTNIEKVKYIREITLSPMNKINKALAESGGDVDKTIQLLIKQKETSAEDIANRKADNAIVYSYVHNNKIGAMIVIASQTDFAAKNDLFIQLAKDICMHIVSNPIHAEYVDETGINEARKNIMLQDLYLETQSKPQPIREKIVNGKMQKWYSDVCLLNQKFIRDETITIKELVNRVAGTIGEKIEIKKFIRLSV